MTAKQTYGSERQWYAIHTYSGYEEKVAESIRQRADSLDMKDKIFQALVPKEKMIEIKNGKRRVVEKRIFQGYVLVQMKMSEDAWYIVRNTPSVTGFVGSILAEPDGTIIAGHGRLEAAKLIGLVNVDTEEAISNLRSCAGPLAAETNRAGTRGGRAPARRGGAAASPGSA